MGAVVKDHWLEWEAPPVTLTRKVERTGRIITPRVIVLHYGVTSSLPALVAAQRARGYWAHLSIDGLHEGGRSALKIHQAMAFNQMGSHAGESSYRGVGGVNAFSIGIEIANPGPLTRCSGGQLRTTYGAAWPEDDAIEARHPYQFAPRTWTHWARYSDQEIDILFGVVLALKAAYPSITALVGHDEISPGRKFDPGPAMQMPWLREKLRLSA